MDKQTLILFFKVLGLYILGIAYIYTVSMMFGSIIYVLDICSSFFDECAIYGLVVFCIIVIIIVIIKKMRGIHNRQSYRYIPVITELDNYQAPF